MAGNNSTLNPALSAGWSRFEALVWLPRDSEAFLDRLRAPDPGERPLPWWWRDLPLALVAGALLGTLLFFLITWLDSPAEHGLYATVALPAPSAPAVVAGPGARKIESEGGQSGELLAGLAPEPAAASAPAALDERRLRRRLRLLARRSRLGRYRGPYRKLLQRGWKHLGAGEFAPAAVAFGRAVHLHPDRAAAYYGLALALFEQGQEGAVLNLLEQAQKKLGPKNDIWVLAGSAYQFLGREKLARTMYRRYLEHNPHGRYARDLKVILSYRRLPTLYPD